MVVVSATVAAFLAPGAHACALIAVTQVGTTADEARSRDDAVRDRNAARRARQRNFEAAVRAGTVDGADGMAELLIPNVREWYADRSDCGPGGDGDGSSMPQATMLADAFAGTELDGLDGDALSDLVTAAFRREPLALYNRRHAATHGTAPATSQHPAAAYRPSRTPDPLPWLFGRSTHDAAERRFVG